jgi:hypothetical protein
LVLEVASEEPLDKLRRYLVGKTVLAVDPPEATEAICRITTSDGKVWRLHATDLGFWIEDALKPGQKAVNFTVLFTEFDRYKHYETPVEYEPPVTVEGDVLVITAFDGKRFEAFIPALSEWEQMVVKHPASPPLLSFAARMGDMWSLAFHKDIDGCPPELCYQAPSSG